LGLVLAAFYTNIFSKVACRSTFLQQTQPKQEMGNQPSNPAIQRVKRAISLQKTPQVKAVSVDGGLTVSSSRLYEIDYDKLLVAKGLFQSDF
jgi:non-canonical (house-cleaning) NTP pyrophosphatase